jgi:hypothetical protein
MRGPFKLQNEQSVSDATKHFAEGDISVPTDFLYGAA